MLSADPADLTKTPISARLAVLFGALGILSLTNGPSLFVVVRLLELPINFDSWGFRYPVVLLGVAAVFAIAHSRVLSQEFKSIGVLLVGLYVSWALLSVQWSVMPEATGLRALDLVFVAAFAVWLGMCSSARERLRAASLAFVIAVAASAALVKWKPLWGGGFWDGERHIRFYGIFASSNSLGPVCVMGTLSFLFAAFDAKPVLERWLWLIASGFAIWLGWGTYSDAARLGFVLMPALVGVLLLARWLCRKNVGERVVMVGLAAVTVFGLLVVTTRLFTTDASLGGRRLIWAEVWDLIALRPLIGYGYWSFWDQPNVSELVAATQNSAHSSLLEAWLGLGAVGALLYVALVIVAVFKAGRAVLARMFDLSSIWWCATVVLAVMFGIMESFTIWNSYLFAILLAGAVDPPTKLLTLRGPAPTLGEQA